MGPIKFRLRFFFIIFFAVMIFGTFGFMMVEDRSFADAFYFSIVTIATVGYGDIHPVTVAGKVLAVCLIVMGVGTFLGVVANATELMLARRERATRLNKLNMVIGVFFSEVGIRLLTVFSDHDPKLEGIRTEFIMTSDWTDKDFTSLCNRLKKYRYDVAGSGIDLDALKVFLSGKRDFLVRLLENPTLLEHESFTDLLRAVFHFVEELGSREEEMSALPESDRKHLEGDINRVYGKLVLQWLDYQRYLCDNYPYLFSLAMRMNPFDRKASPIVK